MDVEVGNPGNPRWQDVTEGAGSRTRCIFCTYAEAERPFAYGENHKNMFTVTISLGNRSTIIFHRVREGKQGNAWASDEEAVAAIFAPF